MRGCAVAGCGRSIRRDTLVTCALALLVAAAGADTAAGDAGERAAPGAVCADVRVTARHDRLGAALLDGVKCMIQAARTQRGLQRLTWQPRLAVTARRHARSMVRRRYFSHVTPGGRDLRSRIEAGRYPSARAPWWVGEVLAWGRQSGARPATVLARWLDSPPHRRVLLSSNACEIGIGVWLGAPVPAARDRPSATFVAELGRRGAACSRRVAGSE